MSPPLLSATVLICTYNRASLLAETLDSLRHVRSARSWSVLVVDNNSTDATRATVERFTHRFPVPITYVFESRQGKSYALNTGMRRCHGEVLVFTDDDVRVSPEWLDAACGPLEADPELDYTGGPVRPLWESAPPAWLDLSRGDLWGTLAILDYGAEPFVFESRQRVPLGANMAVRRRLVELIGGFHPDLGRRGRSLLGQEQAEFFARSRRAGARGMYVPDMTVHHHVPTARLSKHYFRRWWFWKGVSRARVDAMHGCTELGLDLAQVAYFARVPRFVWGSLPRATVKWVGAVARRDRLASIRHEMECVYALGYIRACWVRAARRATPPLPPPQEAASLSR